MSALNPRLTLAAIAMMFGYDPATVISVALTREDVVIRFRQVIDGTPGRFILVSSGFLMTDTTRAQLEGMARMYGYDAGTVVGVTIDQHTSTVRYMAADTAVPTVRSDIFTIADPLPTPSFAAGDPGVPPPSYMTASADDALTGTDEATLDLTPVIP